VNGEPMTVEATVARTANWAVTVLVAGIASSGPASVSSSRSTVSASGLCGSLVIPSTAAPAARMAWQALMISGVAPDWLSATTRYPCQSTVA
jgi:hypothetical protein